VTSNLGAKPCFLSSLHISRSAARLSRRPLPDYCLLADQRRSDGFIGNVEPPLSEKFLDVPTAQREAQVEPDRMLDDHWRKAVAAVGDFSHRASLPAVSPSNYPVVLTKPPQEF
jgi:hypothetical protein